jgi:hypothetical protein
MQEGIILIDSERSRFSIVPGYYARTTRTDASSFPA